VLSRSHDGTVGGTMNYRDFKENPNNYTGFIIHDDDTEYFAVDGQFVTYGDIGSISGPELESNLKSSCWYNLSLCCKETITKYHQRYYEALETIPSRVSS
jgi:hypothetical protein